MSAQDKCYACTHRREVPGSAHSSCYHPSTAEAHGTLDAFVCKTMGRRSGLVIVPTRAASELHIEAAPRGIDNGWFLWPFNYDPVWLERCDGFQAVAETQQAEAGR